MGEKIPLRFKKGASVKFVPQVIKNTDGSETRKVYWVSQMDRLGMVGVIKNRSFYQRGYNVEYPIKNSVNSYTTWFLETDLVLVED